VFRLITSSNIRIASPLLQNLIIADFATSDPYVHFFSDPPDLFDCKKAPKTEVVKRSLNPTFKPQRLPRIRLDDPDQLEKACLMLSVWDHDLGLNPGA
jgi:Ca2+-dependent lipid-binding protein